MMGPYDPPEPLALLIKQLEKGREFTGGGGQTISCNADALLQPACPGCRDHIGGGKYPPPKVLTNATCWSHGGR